MVRILLVCLVLISGCKWKHHVVLVEDKSVEKTEIIQRVYHLEKEAKMLYQAVAMANALEDQDALSKVANAITICYRNWDKKGDFYQYTYNNVKLPYTANWIIKRKLEVAEPLYRQLQENGGIIDKAKTN